MAWLNLVENFLEKTMVFDPDAEAGIDLRELTHDIRVNIGNPGRALTKAILLAKILRRFPNCIFNSGSGSKLRSPQGILKFLRHETAEEALIKANTVIFTATSFEEWNVLTVFRKSMEVPIQSRDVASFHVAYTEDFAQTVAIGRSRDKGRYPMYATVMELLPRIPNATKAFLTGGCAGVYHKGTIFVSDVDQETVNPRVVCREKSEGTNWTEFAGFPSDALIQNCHRLNGLRIKRLRCLLSAFECGSVNIREPISKLPYEWEFGGFLMGVTRSGFAQAGHEVGHVAVITDNFDNPHLEAITAPAAFRNLKKFWVEYFRSN
jgi:hypothetical protein